MKLSHSIELDSNSRPSLMCEVEPFQQLREPGIASERLKERFDSQEVDERCLILDRLVKSFKGEIEIFHSDGSERFRQRAHVLDGCQSPKPFNTLPG